MCNHFNTTVAIEYSINVAIFVQKISEWTFLNLANKRNIHDGLCWSYNTLDAYKKIFPYWSKKQLETVIKKAVDAKLIVKGNFNKSSYDRTCWYALTFKGLSYYPEFMNEDFAQLLNDTISPNWEMEFVKWRNLFPKSETTIPTIKPTIKPTTNTPISPLGEPSSKSIAEKAETKAYTIDDLSADNPHNIPIQMLADWLVVRKSQKAKVTATAWRSLNKNLTKIIQMQLRRSAVEAFEEMVAKGWRSVEPKYFEERKSNYAQPSNSGRSIDDVRCI
jgi:hypothetical protein